jgi:hypothetical protein
VKQKNLKEKNKCLDELATLTRSEFYDLTLQKKNEESCLVAAVVFLVELSRSNTRHLIILRTKKEQQRVCEYVQKFLLLTGWKGWTGSYPSFCYLAGSG